MTNDGIFTGELRHDSPQLDGLLRRFFELEIADIVRETYRLSWKDGACNEMREVGVSFNPLPARICCILIQEGEVNDAKRLQIALLSCTSGEGDDTMLSLSEELKQKVLAVRDRRFPIDSTLEPLYVAHDLDILRHMHMAHVKHIDTSHLLSEIATRAPQYTSSAPRLLELFRHALNRRIEHRG